VAQLNCRRGELSMRLNLWAMGLLALTVSASIVRTEEPAARYKVGDTFTQEVVVSRRSVFSVLGLDVEKWAQYGFASSFTITKVNADGSLVAEQTIRTARLIDCDPDMRDSLAAGLVKTQGVKMELTVAPNGEVTALKAP